MRNREADNRPEAIVRDEIPHRLSERILSRLKITSNSKTSGNEIGRWKCTYLKEQASEKQFKRKNHPIWHWKFKSK
jgi:hypothetical protein